MGHTFPNHNRDSYYRNPTLIYILLCRYLGPFWNVLLVQCLEFVRVGGSRRPSSSLHLGFVKFDTLILGGSWDLVRKVISTLIGVISKCSYIYLPHLQLVTSSHDPRSTA